jgi:hypothetical protein
VKYRLFISFLPVEMEHQNIDPSISRRLYAPIYTNSCTLIILIYSVPESVWEKWGGFNRNNHKARNKLINLEPNSNSKL